MTDLHKAPLCQLLGIQYPIIMAPMFLVTNVEMLVAASNAGITGAIPALNWRTLPEMEQGITRLKNECNGPFGINLIVNKSNIKYQEQLDLCCKLGVDYIITSLGNPKETIEKSHAVGIKVFCDVTNLEYAQKVTDLGADAVIAVNKEAGGHAGKISYKQLLPQLIGALSIPVISAGGVGNYQGVQEMLNLGAAGLSIGSVFIASNEAGVSQEYKQAIVDYNAKDIVMTTKLSGTPCSVIKTPYVEEIGTEQNWLERLLNKNKQLKKWAKMLTFYKGMKALEKAAFSGTYKTLWCAGPSIEYVKEIDSVANIVKRLTQE